MRFREVERIIKDDGWYAVNSGDGSHRQNAHDQKPGKVTIAYHSGDIDPFIVKRIFLQAGIRGRRLI